MPKESQELSLLKKQVREAVLKNKFKPLLRNARTNWAILTGVRNADFSGAILRDRVKWKIKRINTFTLCFILGLVSQT